MGKVYTRNGAVGCGSPQSGNFETTLDLCGNGVDNHVLLIKLRLHLIQVTTIDNWKIIPKGFNAEPFRWSVPEWTEFQSKLKSWATFWHKRFVLVPPDDAKEFSYGSWSPFKPTYMPNVECHFELEFTGSSDRHWEVKVLKSGEKIIEDANTGKGSVELDSKDADPTLGVERDGARLMQVAAVHELGHMLGQPHAGALLKTTDCLRAIQLNMRESPPDAPVASYLLNSHNASACYGLMNGRLVPGVAENVMGLGMTVTEVNAISWQNALAMVLWGKPSLPSGWKTLVRSYWGPRTLG